MAEALFHVGDFIFSIPQVPGLDPEKPDWLMAAIGLFVAISAGRFLWMLIRSYRKFGLPPISKLEPTH
jgi:hypothetical protein